MRCLRARCLPWVRMETCTDPVDTWHARTRELERSLLEAAEALLAHRGTSFTLIPVPGRLPVRCVAIGELARIREMVRSDNAYA
jgi:hypothetical protein